jgi:hypothetical protein
MRSVVLSGCNVAEVLDYKRFSMMVEAGAGTVSDIVWQLLPNFREPSP